MKPPQNLHRSLYPTIPRLLFAKNLSTSPINIPKVSNDLISIFTKQPFSPESPELEALAPLLNTRVVETVLSNFKSWKVAYTFFNWATTQCGYMHNMYTYNAMASILSRARQNAPLRELSMSLVNLRCPMSPGALGFFIRCLGNVGLVNEANELFDRVKVMGLCVPNSYIYNCLLEASSRSSCVGLIEMRLKEMHDCGWVPDKYTLTPLLRVYCNADEPDKASQVFKEMCYHGWLDAHVGSILALAFSKWGQVDKAFELIERMEDQNVRLNEKTLCVLIHGFVKEARVDKALLLFDKMKHSNFVPHVSVYDVLIGGLCTNRELKKALQLYIEMKNMGIKPDLGIVTKLISSFYGEGELTCIFEEINKGMDVESEAFICNSILNHLVNNDSAEKAYHLVRVMMGDECNNDVDINKLFQGKKLVSPNATSFTLVIDGLLKAGKLDLALNLFQDMADSGCKRDIIHYNNLIDGLCNSNRLEESYKLLRKMEESGLEPTHFTHNCIFGCLCRRKDVVGALATAKEMRVHGHEPYTKHSTLLIKELCKHGKVAEACSFLDNMVQEGFSPDIIAYSAALDGLIKSQEVDQAMKIFQDICACGHYPDVVAYNTLMKGLCKAQRLLEAVHLFNEMIMKGLIPSVATYNLLIDGWCKSGQIDNAMLFFSRMSADEMKPNVITYTTLIDGLCNAGRPDDAVMLWNEMRGKGCMPTRVTFMTFIHGLCKCGRPDAALVHFREMEKKEMKPDAYVYVALISAFVSSLNLPLAFEILKNMVEKGDFPDPHDKNYTILRDAMPKLLEDNRTSSSLKDLIAKVGIATKNPQDNGGRCEPT